MISIGVKRRTSSGLHQRPSHGILRIKSNQYTRRIIRVPIYVIRLFATLETLFQPQTYISNPALASSDSLPHLHPINTPRFLPRCPGTRLYLCYRNDRNRVSPLHIETSRGRQKSRLGYTAISHSICMLPRRDLTSVHLLTPKGRTRSLWVVLVHGNELVADVVLLHVLY